MHIGCQNSVMHCSSLQASTLLRDYLAQHRVLLVLDNVTNARDARRFLGERMHPGSRVLATSWAKGVLQELRFPRPHDAEGPRSPVNILDMVADGLTLSPGKTRLLFLNQLVEALDSGGKLEAFEPALSGLVEQSVEELSFLGRPHPKTLAAIGAALGFELDNPREADAALAFLIGRLKAKQRLTHSLVPDDEQVRAERLLPCTPARKHSPVLWT